MFCSLVVVWFAAWSSGSGLRKQQQQRRRRRFMADVEDDLLKEKNPRPLDEDDIALLKTYVSYRGCW
jgi:hypothetical protein